MPEFQNEAEELAWLEEQLIEGPAKNSILSTVQIGSARANGELQWLRFLHRFWQRESGFSMRTVIFVYKAAEKLGDPLENVTDNDIHLANALIRDEATGFPRKDVLNDGSLNDTMTYVLENREHSSLVLRIVIELGIRDVGRIREIVENSDGSSFSLTEGTL